MARLIAVYAVDFIPHWSKGNWVIVIFGESHLAVLHLTDFTVRSPCAECLFPKSFSSNAVNFYPAIRVYGSSEGGELHPLNDVTKCDDDPGCRDAGWLLCTALERC
jgi:hypothetical protein